MRRMLLGIGLLALVLSACELRAEIAVNDNGSGTLGVLFAADQQTLAMLGSTGGDPFAEMRADFADDPVKWTVTDYNEGGLKGVRATFAFTSIADLREKSRLLDSGGQSDAGFEDFALERRADGGWTFSGTSTDTQGALGQGESPIPPAQLEALVNLQLRITLPGSPAAHNADEVTRSGGRSTFIWKPKLSAKSVAMSARTTPGGSSFPVLPVALGVGGFAAAAAVIAMRRKAGPPPVSAEPATPPSDVAAVDGVEPPSDAATPGAPATPTDDRPEV